MSETNPFVGIGPALHDVIEKLLGHLWAAGEWDDEHEDFLDQWRAARGEDGMDVWRWWIGEIDGESYDEDFASRDEAITEGRNRYADEGEFQIVEARTFNDLVKEAEDISPFAQTRNFEKIKISAND
jgi:hypothetical protein